MGECQGGSNRKKRIIGRFRTGSIHEKQILILLGYPHGEGQLDEPLRKQSMSECQGVFR